nr:NTP transferase domain-containing protein [Actinomycetota bacterium]
MLAAGAATRYGGPKQVELLPAVLDALGRSQIAEVVVVAGAHPLEVTASGARLIQCAAWADGPGASLRCGLAALGEEISHALIVLADGPTLDPRAVDRLLDRAADGPVLAASYDGVRSHPVLLARSAWAAVPDEGGRAFEAELVDC